MKYINVLVLLLILSSCAKDNSTLIARNQLGYITQRTKFSDIEQILKRDSVVIENATNPYGANISSTVKSIRVYDTSGQQTLLIKPAAGMDSLSAIKSIRVLTDKYKTKDGISLGSSYAEIKKHHDISNIQSSLKSVILTLKDINAFVSFDREVLPGDVRFDLDADIKKTMISDNAEINRFWLNFEADPKHED